MKEMRSEGAKPMQMVVLSRMNDLAETHTQHKSEMKEENAGALGRESEILWGKHIIIRFAYNLTILLRALELIHKSMCTMLSVPHHSQE